MKELNKSINNICTECNKHYNYEILGNENLRINCGCTEKKTFEIKNYLAKELSEELIDTKCINHENRPGIYACNECQDYYCFECFNSDHKDHQFDNIEKPEICDKCGDKFNEYCVECKKYYICKCEQRISCSDPNHKIIKFNTNDDSDKKLYEKFIREKNNFFEYILKLKNTYIQELQKNIKLIQDQYNNMIEIKNNFFDLIEIMLNNKFVYRNNYDVKNMIEKNFIFFNYDKFNKGNNNNNENILLYVNDLIEYFKKLTITTHKEDISNIHDLNIQNQISSISSLNDTDNNIIAFSTLNDKDHIEIIDINNGFKSKSCKLTNNNSIINNILFLQNDQLLTSSLNNIITLWKKNKSKNTSYFSNQATFEGHRDIINKIIKINDNRIISCSNDYSIIIWSVNPYTKKKEIIQHVDWVNSISFIKDLNILVSGAGEDDSSIIIWKPKDDNFSDLKMIKQIKDTPCNHKNGLFYNKGILFVGSFDEVNFINLNNNYSKDNLKLSNKGFGNITNFVLIKNNDVLCSSENRKFLLISYNQNKASFKVLLNDVHEMFINDIIDLKENIFVSSDYEKLIRFWRKSLN